MLAEGICELRRKCRRVQLRLALWRGERARAQAEIDLGLLGWEQVDVFDHEVQAEMDRLQKVERSQAALLNLSAELSEKLAGLEAELHASRARHEETMRGLLQTRAPLVQRLEELEESRRERMEAGRRFDRALRELQELPRERQIVATDRARVQMEIDRMEKQIAAAREAVHGAGEAIASEEAAFAEIEARLAPEIRKLSGQRKKSEESMDKMDREKRQPYRAIGAVLADFEIAPLNQPEMLQKVYELRAAQAARREELAASSAESAQANPVQLRNFYVLASAVAAAALAILAALLV